MTRTAMVLETFVSSPSNHLKGPIARESLIASCHSESLSLCCTNTYKACLSTCSEHDVCFSTSNFQIEAILKPMSENIKMSFVYSFLTKKGRYIFCVLKVAISGPFTFLSSITNLPVFSLIPMQVTRIGHY